MALSELEEQCFAVLDDTSLDEDDRVDKVEELVRGRYPKSSSKQLQKIAMDIMWKHEDPSKFQKPTAHIVNVREVETKIDIPDLERRLQLERQFLELDAMNQKVSTSTSRPAPAPVLQLKSKHSTNPPVETVNGEREYQDLLHKTNELKQELYGDVERPTLNITSTSPIDYISSFFNGSVPRTRINQALKSSGYIVLDAVQLLIGRLKQDQGDTTAATTTITSPQNQTQFPVTQQEQQHEQQQQQPVAYTPTPYTSYAPTINTPQPFFDPGKKNKAICSFLLRYGKCLRSDCQFSHDIEQRVCSFWMNGHCVAGDSCPFKHSLDDLSGHESNQQTSYGTPSVTQLPSLTSEEQFPALPSSSGSNTSSSKKKPFKKFNAASASFIPAYVSSTPSFVPQYDLPVTSTPAAPPSTGQSVSTAKSSAIAIVKPLRKPKLIPWEVPTTEENEYLKNYVLHRSNAIKFENQRRKFAQISTDSWRTNDGARSKQMSDKANKFEQKSFDSLKMADDELYNYSETTSDEVWFEFHGLQFNEAIEQLSESLKEVKNKSKNQTRVVYIVVPSVSYDHNEYKKTTKPISLWLDHEGYRWQLHGCGNGQYGSVIAIDPFL